MVAQIDNMLTLRLDRVTDAAIGENRIGGSVVMVVHDGTMVYARAAGYADREARRSMELDAIFRFTSLTKPIVATAALAMLDQRIFGLDDCVSDHIPYFAPLSENGEPVTIPVRHLLSHTAGLSYDAADLARVDATSGQFGAIIPLEENVRRIGTMPLKFAPGSAWLYSTATDVLGAMIAHLNRSSLEDVVQRYVTGPLWMDDTRFSVTDPSRLCPPYGATERGLMRMGDGFELKSPTGSSKFSPSRIFNPQVPQSGGSGMAGTARDFVTFLEALRMGGGSVLKPETVAMAMQNQIGDIQRDDPGWGFGFLGAVLKDPVAASSPQSVGTVRWGGVYGHNWFIDPESKLTVVSLSNSAPEGNNGPYRSQVRDAVYGAGN